MDSHTEWNKHITLLLRIASEKKVPEWRFGQLIENLKRYMGTDDLYYIEDYMLAEEIIKFFDLDEDFRHDIPELEHKPISKLCGIWLMQEFRDEWLSGTSIEKLYKCSLCGRLENNKEPYCICGAQMLNTDIKD